MNAGNLLNSDWGIRQVQAVPSGSILRPTVNATTGEATYQLVTVGGKLPTTSFNKQISTATTWGAQVGLRYIF